MSKIHPAHASDGRHKTYPYDIVASLGASGMGEVHRACDARLDRTVPPQFCRSICLIRRKRGSAQQTNEGPFRQLITAGKALITSLAGKQLE